MSWKYIIEIEGAPYKNSQPNSTKLYRAVGFKSLMFDQRGLHKLTPYSRDKVYEDGYQRGLNAAWEAARKLVLAPDHGGYSWDELEECFGECWKNYYDLFNKFRPEEAIEAIRSYEERKAQDAEIKVGDEVEYGDDGKECRFAVTYIDCFRAPIRLHGFTTLDRDGAMGIGEMNYCDADIVRKTGRHVDLAELFGGEDA